MPALTVSSRQAGHEVMARLGELGAEGHPVAMVLADLALAPLDGVDVLSRVRRVTPIARRVLLLDWGLLRCRRYCAPPGWASPTPSSPNRPGPRRGISQCNHRGPRRLGVDYDADRRGGEGGRRWPQQAHRRDPRPARARRCSNRYTDRTPRSAERLRLRLNQASYIRLSR